MDIAIDTLKTGLRVLTALSHYSEPDPADVGELRRLAPLLAGAPVDQLACEVIQQVMRNRAELRAKGAVV